MANVDNPRGFRPVRSLDQSGLTGKIQSFTVAGSTTLAIGDVAGLASGLATKAASGADVLGVVVGVGDESAITFGGTDGLFNPDDLTRVYATAGQSVSVILANDVVFSAQTDADLDLAVGAACDFLPGTFTAGTHNRSQAEVDAASNNDCLVVEYPLHNDANGATGAQNDSSLANAQVNVIFVAPIFAQS